MLLPRRRLVLLLCLILTIVAGLASRQIDVGKLPGDALWASAAYFALGLIFPWLSRGQVLVGAIVIAFAVEFSQLYHAGWIDSIRSYRIGHLFLGNTFHIPDLLAYVTGALLAMLLDFSAPRMTRSSSDK